MRLVSPAYPDGARIPVEHANVGHPGGHNVPIPFEWSDEPDATRSFALSVIDTHPRANRWVHWAVVDIPPSAHALAVGAPHAPMPPGLVELRNTFGEPGYGGPRPPAGTGVHTYVATLYALDVPHLSWPVAPTAEEFEAAVAPHTLAESRYVGILSGS